MIRYTAPQVARAARITMRQLAYWTARGWIHDEPRPDDAGSGTPRHYSAAELHVARDMAAFHRAGFTHAAAAELARRARGGNGNGDDAA